MSWMIWIYDDTNSKSGDQLIYELEYVRSEDMIREAFMTLDMVHGTEFYDKSRASKALTEAVIQYLHGESAKVFQGLLDPKDAEKLTHLISETFGSEPDIRPSSLIVAVSWLYYDEPVGELSSRV